MQVEHRQQLLVILARLDQLKSEAVAALAEPVHADLSAMAEDVRETLVEMQAKVETRLDRFGE